MGWIVSTPPTVEPVTVADLQQLLRISEPSFDAELTRKISAARQAVEAFLKKQLINATYQWSMDYWPYYFEVPQPPLVSVSSIKYYDTATAQQTWAGSNYQVDTTGVHGTITPAYNVSYPQLQPGKKNAIVVEYVAGYGAAAVNVPECIREAILSLASYWFENPMPVNIGNIVNELPQHIRWMLEPEMVAETY